MTMYLEHFGLREPPFRITPHTEFFFAGANRGATLEALVYTIMAGEGLIKVTGEVGTGKTMLCRVLMERLPEEVVTIYLAVPSLNRDEMLVAIAGELGIESRFGSTTQLLRELQQRLIALHIQERQVVALIDEAHAMPIATLEELRLLSNMETGKEKLLQIVLFGQPELDQHLNQPNMRQIRERITHAFDLSPLPPREIEEYIDFRLRAAGYRGPELFNAETLRIIVEASEGLTRRVNIYADKTLLAAYAAGTHTVTADFARAAVSDSRIVAAPKATPKRLPLVALTVLAVLVACIALGLAAWLYLKSRPVAAPAAESVAPATSAASPAPPAAQPAAGQASSPSSEAVTPPPRAPTQAPPATPATSPPAAPTNSPPSKTQAAAQATAQTPPSTAAAEPPPKATATSHPLAPGKSEAISPGSPAAKPASRLPVDTVATVAPENLASRAPAMPGTEEADSREPERPAAKPAQRVRSARMGHANTFARLEGFPGGHFVVQLLTADASRSDYLDYFLRTAARSLDPQQLFLFPYLEGTASAQIGVVYGVFSTRQEAKQALSALPDFLRQYRPFVRTVEEVRESARLRPAG